MAILWCGGEDIDFNGAVGYNGSPNQRRTAYSRSAIYGSAGVVYANPVTAFTDCWFSCWIYWANGANAFCAGLANNSLSNASGIYLGINGSGKFTLSKYDGTTTTTLQTDTGAAWGNDTINKVDIHLVSYGATATVACYKNGSTTPMFTFSGNVVTSSFTNLNCVTLSGTSGNGVCGSEFILADEDTRTFSLVTMSPNALGTTDQWTGTYTDVNPLAINDANAVFTNTVTQDEQFNISDLPSGVFFPRAIKIAARASNTSGATAVKVGLGVNSGGTVAPGTLQATTTAWQNFEVLNLVNPVTSVAWTQAEVNALQINLRSGS